MTTEDVIVAFRSPSRRKGFAQIPNVVILDKSLSDGAIRLYALLVSYAMQTGSFKINQAAMGEDIGKGERTVRTLLKELAQRGLVTIHRQGVMLPNIYFIEDAYALYDSEQPKVKQQTRTATRPVIAAENGRSQKPESDRQKMADHCGQNQPVIAAENGRLLKSLSPKKKEKESEILPSALPEQEKPPTVAASHRLLAAADSAFARDWRARQVKKGGAG